jgi:hypothetical protein
MWADAAPLSPGSIQFQANLQTISTSPSSIRDRLPLEVPAALEDEMPISGEMPITFDTLPNGNKKARTKVRTSEKVLGELEIPSGKTPDQNAWLTLTLNYTLTFLDRTNPNPQSNGHAAEKVLTNAEGTWYAKDASGFMFPVRDWDFQAKDKFGKMFDAGWQIWNHRFIIMTPEDFDQLDYQNRGQTIRPNILCLFRMNRVFDPRNAHNFNIVRLDPMPDNDIIYTENGKTEKKFKDGFRPTDETMADDAWLRETLGHELGHVLGLDHILALEGEPMCKVEGKKGLDRCYGVTLEEMHNIMGKGRNITLINARPWRQHLQMITNTHIENWNFVLTADPKQRDLAPKVVRTSSKAGARPGARGH